MSTARTVFMFAWLAAWLVIGCGAYRSISALWRMTETPTAHDRVEVDVAAWRARRWAYSLVGLGCVMAALGPVIR